jgi:hypothetical protein
MTLTELADFVCNKIGRTDSDAVADCKSFLNARYKMLWDSALWTDTQSVVTVTTTASVPFALMPIGVERVLEVRDTTDSRLLSSIPQNTFLQLSANDFGVAGTTVAFAQVAPAIAYSANSLVLYMGAYVDVSDITARIVGESATTGIVTVYDIHLEDDSLAGTPIESTSGVAASGAQWLLSYSKEPYTESLQALRVVSSGGTPVLASIDYDGTTTISPRRARIRLLQHNTASLSLLCLVKRQCPGLTEDADSPELRNADNALIAFGTADMLERDRQYAKARLLKEEAAALVKQMLDLERNQQANVIQIVPYDCHDDYVSDHVWSKGYWS